MYEDTLMILSRVSVWWPLQIYDT